MDEPAQAELKTESHGQRRLSRQSQTLWIALPILMAAMLGVVRLYTGNDWSVDRAITLWVLTFASPALDSIMLAATDLGAPFFVFVITLGLGVVLMALQRPRETLFIFAGVGIAIALSQIVKLGFGLARPVYRAPLVTEATFSYTSGHASASMALVAALVVLTWHTRWRWPVLVMGMMYVLVIGFSRIYLGVHFPSDIWGGWLLTIAVVAVATLLRRQPVKPEPKKTEKTE